MTNAWKVVWSLFLRRAVVAYLKFKMRETNQAKRTMFAVGGFSSDAGKTTLLCQLLRAFPGWEAIKITRGHYRSCGKDPHACCVSHLLSEEPVVYSGRRQTYAPGKDTGRFWDAGAVNVHWVIVTDRQVERGIELALERVQAPGVLIEGTGFLRFMDVDFAILAARAEAGQMKPSARRALSKASGVYLFDDESGRVDDGREHAARARGRFAEWVEASKDVEILSALPVYTRDDLPVLVARLREIHESRVLRAGIAEVVAESRTGGVREQL